MQPPDRLTAILDAHAIMLTEEKLTKPNNTEISQQFGILCLQTLPQTFQKAQPQQLISTLHAVCRTLYVHGCLDSASANISQNYY